MPQLRAAEAAREASGQSRFRHGGARYRLPYDPVVRFNPTPLSGAVLVGLERHTDERGSFARAFCEREFGDHGLPGRFPQANLSTNAAAGTLRGMHFNREPDGEAKLVRCVRGAIFDVIVDLRPESPTRWQWYGTELSSANGDALFVPAGCAHGFTTLQPESDVLYLMGSPFVPEAARGLRWSDPALGIAWPRRPAVISERDATYPLIDRETFDLTA